MKVLVFGAALVSVCAAHSQLYVERIKQRNSHLSHPPAAQNPPLPDLYAADSQSQYTQLYGGSATQDSYQQLYGGSAQQPQRAAGGGGGGGYGRPEPEEDDYQPGYGQQQQAPTQPPATTRRPISYSRPTPQNEVRTTRQPWSHQQTVQHRQAAPSYPQPSIRATTTTRRPILYPRPLSTTVRPSGYPAADPEDLDTPGYGQPSKQTEQPAYPQPAYPQPTAQKQKQPSTGGYGNDLDDLDQSGYGNGQPTAAVQQPSGGGYGNADLDDVETGGYGGPARQTQYKQLYPAESQATESKRNPSSGYHVARELPNPEALTQGSFFESRSNPDYFPQTPWNTPSIAPAFQLQAVQQPLGYLVVDHATQW